MLQLAASSWRSMMVGSIAFVLLAGSGAVGAAKAQTLLDRIERIEGRMIDMERQVYRGDPPPRATGPVARSASARAANIELRMIQLEEQIRHLTGAIEEKGHQADQLAKRIDKLAADFALRLQDLERYASDASATAPAIGGDLGPVPQPSAAASRSRVADTRAGSTQPSATAGQGASLALATPPALDAGTPKERYKLAKSLVRKSAFAEAEDAFRAFLRDHPGDALAPNAQYWLGETLYVREKYEAAARVFLVGFQRYPNSNKSSDSLLKLGLTLAQLGQREEACATFDELLRRLPKKERRLRPKAEFERRHAKCR